VKAYDEHMIQCPKCGSGDVYGPQYTPAPFKYMADKMLWRCANCGFCEETYCKDSDLVTR
jgi:uncharacterized Zn finger protein